MKITASRFTAVVALLGASLALPSAVHAQGAAPAKGAPPAATPAPAPAFVPTPVPPEQRAAIKELLDVMNTKDSLAKTFQAMAQTLPPQMAQAMNRQIENSSLTPEQRVKLREGMNAPFDATVKEANAVVTSPKLVDETIEKMYPIYAKYFTTADIKQLVAFYKSPLGAKTLTSMPMAINESLQAGVAGFQPKINAMMEKTMKTQMETVTGGAAAPAAAATPAPAKK